MKQNDKKFSKFGFSQNYMNFPEPDNDPNYKEFSDPGINQSDKKFSELAINQNCIKNSESGINQNCKKLSEFGIDAEGVISRTGIDESVYLSICKKFLKDKSFSSLQEALSQNDFHNAEIHSHTLKGVAANLGFRYLEYISSEMLKSLRSGQNGPVTSYNNNLIIEYNRIIWALQNII